MFGNQGQRNRNVCSVVIYGEPYAIQFFLHYSGDKFALSAAPFGIVIWHKQCIMTGLCPVISINYVWYNPNDKKNLPCLGHYQEHRK